MKASNFINICSNQNEIASKEVDHQFSINFNVNCYFIIGYKMECNISRKQ